MFDCHKTWRDSRPHILMHLTTTRPMTWLLTSHPHTFCFHKTWHDQRPLILIHFLPQPILHTVMPRNMSWNLKSSCIILPQDLTWLNTSHPHTVYWHETWRDTRLHVLTHITTMGLMYDFELAWHQTCIPSYTSPMQDWQRHMHGWIIQTLMSLLIKFFLPSLLHIYYDYPAWQFDDLTPSYTSLSQDWHIDIHKDELPEHTQVIISVSVLSIFPLTYLL